MSFPRYPSYKPSGVEWLGDVPAHWAAVRLRQLGRLLKGSGGSKEDIVDEGVPCVRYGDLYTTHRDFIANARTRVSSDRAADYVPLQYGDVLFAGSGETFEEIGKSAVNLIDGKAVCGGDLIILRPDTPVHPRFLGYACDSSNAATQKAMMGRGATVKHIYPDELRHLALCVPPPDEQIAIAAFLDRETAKIDALVAEQERLLELLKEKRQAVISHAVTKGLDPEASTKPSGVEWLGDIPSHWAVRPVRSMATVVRGASPRPAGDPRFFDGDSLPWITVAEVTKDDEIRLRETESRLTVAGVGQSRIFPSGTLIYTNSGVTLGVPKILAMDACGNDGIVGLLDLDGSVAIEYLYLSLSSLTATIRERVRQGSGQPNLNTDIVKAIPVAVPPLSEQRAIVEYARHSVSSVDSLIASSRAVADLACERRSALISAAVTGQIDLRGLN